MAIDAKIKSVEQEGNNLILKLEPRVDENGFRSIAGQERLTVLDFQYKPDVGDAIWGGSGSVQIARANGRPTMHYKRVGYTQLREDLDAPFRSQQSPRFA